MKSLRRISRRSQRGEGNLGCVLWAIALGLVVLICWKMVPVKIASARLYDFMEEQAKYAAKKSPEKIAKGIVNRAAELELPVTDKDVEVRRIGDSIKMRVSYTVDVEFPGYTYEWDFEHVVDRAIYIF